MPMSAVVNHFSQGPLDVFVSVFYYSIHFWPICYGISMIDLVLLICYFYQIIVKVGTIVCDDRLGNSKLADNAILNKVIHDLLYN